MTDQSFPSMNVRVGDFLCNGNHPRPRLQHPFLLPKKTKRTLIIALFFVLMPLTSVNGFSWIHHSLRASKLYRSLSIFRGSCCRTAFVSSTSLLFASPTTVVSSPPLVEWDIYVDQSKASLDKGGSATFDAFVGLAPPTLVRVLPSILPRTKAKGPVVRCISRTHSGSGVNASSFDVGNVDSVDKVFRVLSKHMGVKGISSNVCDCLKWKYRGNGHLEAGKVALAIDAYNKALACAVDEQEGIVLLMRATAYLQRAAAHKKELKQNVDNLIKMVPNSQTLQTVYEEASQEPALANSIFRHVLEDAVNQKQSFRRTQYRHGLYQYALLQAAQDSLRATQLLPQYATSWLRAGEILGELWKLKESAQYYDKAMSLDASLSDSVKPIIERLRTRQELLDSARAYGWSEDTLRLALDVSG